MIVSLGGDIKPLALSPCPHCCLKGVGDVDPVGVVYLYLLSDRPVCFDVRINMEAGNSRRQTLSVLLLKANACIYPSTERKIIFIFNIYYLLALLNK